MVKIIPDPQVKESKAQSLDALRIAAIAFETQTGIAVTDSNGFIIQVNSSFTNITGYSSDEVIGQNMSLLQSGRHDTLFYRHLWSSLKDNGAWQGEIWNKHKDGRIYLEMLFIKAISSPDSNSIYYVANFFDITQRKLMEDHIQEIAFHDPLTHLANRHLMEDRLTQIMAASKRSGLYGAVIFLDLDNFKPLNDTHGHNVGDLLLIEVARRLLGCVREMDTVARFGGDEFVVMLSELDVDKQKSATQAQAVTEKIRIALAEPYVLFIKMEGESDIRVEHSCSASIGATLFLNHEVTQAEIFRQADVAMYQAKEAGRNRVNFHQGK